MTTKIGFFEIPAVDFDRAVKFYTEALGFGIDICGCDSEKMGMIECENTMGSISKAEGFNPSPDGTMLTFEVDDIDKTLQKVVKAGGRIDRGKTMIEAEGMGYFALFFDTEGNRLGIHSA